MKDKYYTKMLKTLVNYNDWNNAPFSNENIRQAVSRVMAETEKYECDSKSNAINLTMDTFFNQYPVKINTQRKNANVKNERRIYSYILAETIYFLNELTIQSTINDSKYNNSEEDDAESDPKSDSLVATHTSDRNEMKITDTDTTNRNSTHKLLTNREIPAIIQGVIPPVNQTTADGVATYIRALHAVLAVLHKEIVMGATRSTSGVLKDPPVINWKDVSGPIPVDKTLSEYPPEPLLIF